MPSVRDAYPSQASTRPTMDDFLAGNDQLQISQPHDQLQISQPHDQAGC